MSEDDIAEFRCKAQQRADKIEQVVDAPEYLFSKHGLYGVTLKDVAKSVGFTTRC